MPIEPTKEEIPTKCKLCKYLTRYTEFRYGKDLLYGCTYYSRLLKIGDYIPICEFKKLKDKKNKE